MSQVENVQVVGRQNQGESYVEVDVVDGRLAVDAVSSVESSNDYRVYNLDLGTSRSEVALEGSSVTIRWVKLQVYTGANSNLGTPDQYVRVGSNTDPKIPLSKLSRPDSDVLFEGKVSGDIYLTNTAQTGERIVLIVGIQN